ncbi:phosphotransferase family enzyme [Paenibacillus cellulosilyticus]|uniref:Phosphotransferase family enzyme n=1 Tax=Paenibacillus cellulosilyticus TaxID=375489 RepID=A0A2V2YEL9_9BACL|nr:aminoglycoside phosphotransferase family protein [Paenibacillus cellulosilyticus]PWV89331.1 phosphotransferase family enzyme [Paenibacillus cellulosilyticus]QKS45172.1 aminoglycoside phosphotransferase family protein [Paenibacillus cellulosilyticus]
MDSQTKNKQSNEILSTLIDRAFPGVEAVSIKELTEGFFNVAYIVELSDGRETVLKIAPPVNSLIMTHEHHIMSSEVESMRLAAEQTDVPVAKILYYDNSREICNADYFFMEKLPGRSFHSIMGELSDEVRLGVDVQVGQLNRRINSIVGERFGYFGQPYKQGDVWFDVFMSIVQDAINDAAALNIDLTIDIPQLLSFLERDKPHFEEITTPRLVHWDLWAGNVFIEDGKVTGVIDFERCMWADELLEVGFRGFANNHSFVEGYGITEWTESQRIRVHWYDMYLFLISALECDYRHYDDRGAYDWATQMLREGIQTIAARQV